MERGENLSNFVVGSVPTVFYIPDFITDSEQDQLLNKIYQAPVSKWKSLKNRKLQNWVPPWLKRVTERIFEESCLFPSAINHVLINEYLPNQGIMATERATGRMSKRSTGLCQLFGRTSSRSSILLVSYGQFCKHKVSTGGRPVYSYLQQFDESLKPPLI